MAISPISPKNKKQLFRNEQVCVRNGAYPSRAANVRVSSMYARLRTGGISKFSHVRPYFASIHASLMRCVFLLLDARPASPDRRAASRPRFASARNEGPTCNPKFVQIGTLGLSVLVILWCGELCSDILAQNPLKSAMLGWSRVLGTDPPCIIILVPLARGTSGGIVITA